MNLGAGRSLDDRKVAQFAAVVREGSVRAGAEALDLDPSVVSRAVARLEAEWGAVLLERRGRGVTITEAGKLVYEYFERHQKLRQELIAQAEALTTLERGHVDILCGSGYLKLVSIAVQRFLDAYPGVTLNITADSDTNAYHRVLSDEFMVALVFSNSVNPGIYRHNSQIEPISLVVRPDHDLTKIDGPIRLKNLLEYNGYLVNRSYSIRDIISAAELHDGVSLKVAINSASFDIILSALIKGDGYTLIPPRGITAYINSGKLVALPVDNPVLRSSENCIISRKGRTLPPAARAFTKVLIATYAAYDGDLTPQTDNDGLYGTTTGS